MITNHEESNSITSSSTTTAYACSGNDSEQQRQQSEQQQQQQQQQSDVSTGSPSADCNDSFPQQQSSVNFVRKLYANSNTGCNVFLVEVSENATANPEIIARVLKTIPVHQGSTLHERELEHFDVCVRQHCRCKNILRYFQCGVDEKVEERTRKLDILMEYADQGSLDEVEKQITDLKKKVAVAKAAARQILFGLVYYWKIHNRVTRDTKPSNMFCFSDGRVAVGDFDVSRTLEKKQSGVAQNETCPGVSRTRTASAETSFDTDNSQTADRHARLVYSQEQMADLVYFPEIVCGKEKFVGLPSRSSLRKAPGEITMTGAGTPTYQAPEPKRGEKYYNPSISDTWSFGASILSFFAEDTEGRNNNKAPFTANSIPTQQDVAKLLHWKNVTDPALKFLLERCLIVDFRKRMNLVEALAITYVVRNPQELETSEESKVWENCCCLFNSSSLAKAGSAVKHFGIKLCDEVLRDCVCLPTDPDVDEKIKRASEALDEEFLCWRDARLKNASNKEVVKGEIDYSMFKIVKERCKKSYSVMKNLFEKRENLTT